MRGSCRLILAFALNMMSQIATANEIVTTEKFLESLRVKIARPQIKDIRHLSKLKGFTKFDEAVLKSIMNPETMNRFENSSGLFWNSSLLLAMAGSVDQPVLPQAQGDSSEIDEWLLRHHEKDDAYMFSWPEYRKLNEIHLVFLKQRGFAKIESSQELMVAGTKDFFGGVPVVDFCARSPGRKAPVNFSVRFTPWDFATRLASSSRLDTSLLQLVVTPDAFDFDVDDEANEESEKDVMHGDEHGLDDEGPSGWELALRKNESYLKSPQAKLSEFVAKVRQNNSISKSARRLIMAAALNVDAEKKYCEKLSGQWKEIAWGENKSLELFSCRAPDGKLKGSSLIIENGDIEKGEIKFSHKIEDVVVEAFLARNHPWLAVRLFYGDKQVGSESWFDEDGFERARRQITLTAQNGNLLNKSGAVVWIDSVEKETNLKGISFYDTGAVKSFAMLNKDKKVESFVGFYPSGKPRYLFPIRNGKFDGQAIWWHESGQIAGEVDYVADKRFGRGRIIYENGVIGYNATYTNNQLHGQLTWFDPNQRLLFSLNFLDNKAHGVLEIKNGGRRIVEARFEGGTVEGAVILRNSTGIDVAEIPYKGGLLNGKVVLRDGKGNTRVKSDWLDGQANGLTESLYANGVKASQCNFKVGHLVDWSSFRIDGSYRYKGEVLNFGEGQTKIDYFGGGKNSTLQCISQDWYVEKCDAVQGEVKTPMPSMKELVAKIDGSGELKFKPEKCGGFTKVIDVAKLIDQENGTVDIGIRMKDECPSVTMANGMHCVVGLKSNKWSVDSCVLFDEDNDPEDTHEDLDLDDDESKS